MKARAYGTRYAVESMESVELTFYWFEYVPEKGLVRIHDGNDEKRRDYYLAYEDGILNIELETDDEGHTWNTKAGGSANRLDPCRKTMLLGHDI